SKFKQGTISFWRKFESKNQSRLFHKILKSLAMGTPIYTPIFRYRQEEKKVLSSFDFGDKIYPYIEIFKKLERKHTSKKKAEPEFHEIYLPILRTIKSEKVFIDLPIQLKPSSRMKKEVLEFQSRVI